MRKGIIHNGNHTKGTVWRKNKVYLEGYEQVRKMKNIDKRMLLGKMKIDDLNYFKS
jgi:hypothetical protein